ncbi:hypothetical protein ACFFQF_09145 [Haladaptatus pallidirubidus]|uniref:hypothetical protein n=1 Tax=Haladaptatus pallidirubidus TaxID=1008152 RepID=UPI001D122D7D|nr:hypothetical protein [Haladaptatus pallidirubidus]
MRLLLIGLAVVSFVAQLVMLYGRYIQDKPRIVLVTDTGYALFWAYLAAVGFFELHFATIGFAVLLAILLPLTVVSFRRQRQDTRTQSA